MKDKDETNGTPRFSRILDILSSPQNYVFKTTTEMPHCNDYIQWIYTIDLDNNKFLVENIETVHSFDLVKLRKNLFLEKIEGENNINDLDISDDDTETDIELKINILENLNKINKMKLFNRKLNK